MRLTGKRMKKRCGRTVAHCGRGGGADQRISRRLWWLPQDQPRQKIFHNISPIIEIVWNLNQNIAWEMNPRENKNREEQEGERKFIASKRPHTVYVFQT